MKVQVLSDLHFEVNRDFIPQVNPLTQVLVVVGDVGISGRGHLKTGFEKLCSALSLVPTRPIVLFVPGNHEYDRQDWDLAHAEIQTLCTLFGIIFFDHGDQVIEQVRFVGITLWSDFDLLGSALRDKSMLAAKHYLASTGSTRFGKPFDAEQARQLGTENRQWLSDKLSLRAVSSAVRKTVVLTHFAPSPRSADPRYGLIPSTASFCNDAQDLLPRANLWVHGHLHHSVDYVQHGCRVVSNPLGYAKKGEQAHFQHELVLDV